MYYFKSTPPQIAATAAAAAVAAFFLLRRRSKDPVAQVPAGQQHHPSAMRNRIPILKALLKLLPESDSFSGPALEIATGTGALMEVVAPAFPYLTMQPSEYVPETAAAPDEQWSKHGKIGLRLGLDELACIDEHCKVFKNCVPAVALDLSKPWPTEVTEKNGSHVLILCANTLHITPWACSVGLLWGAGQALAPDGHLVLYGPFKVSGEFIGADGGAGNAKFDAKLRSTNAEWGIRDVGELEKVAEGFGLALSEKVEMPANNLCLHFTKAS
ncbi:hypothetical protein TrVE_jg4402 [Triparma verrucosa]|uniref:DUF938 domain-containing protein n=1 Tax=Triparma verrucosa TaxID=1606542 RepID=A0A9W7FDA2_9STRA|nr:hypothetical protein TrVE_jg4402 [Triparma verrucosa]